MRTDLRKIFDGSLVQVRPADSVTLVDNHDTQPGQALESWISAAFKPLAYALILWRGDGYPCVFAGDLYGIREPKMEPMSQLSDFIRVRKLFAYGPTRDYFDHRTSSHPILSPFATLRRRLLTNKLSCRTANTVGWVREGDAEHDGCAVVICNGTEEGMKRMQVRLIFSLCSRSTSSDSHSTSTDPRWTCWRSLDRCPRLVARRDHDWRRCQSSDVSPFRILLDRTDVEFLCIGMG